MIDLTPLDVRKKREDFRKGMRGYDQDEVNQFLETVADRLEVLVKENLELKERASRLEEKVEEQGARESAVREALVTAQELREEIRGQARREAEAVVREAENRARSLGQEAESRSRGLLDSARRESENRVREAKREAEGLVTDAREAARRTREEAGRVLAERRAELRGLIRARKRFLLERRTLLEREMDALEVAEAADPERDFPASVLEGPEEDGADGADGVDGAALAPWAAGGSSVDEPPPARRPAGRTPRLPKLSEPEEG
jgi:cell division initiation protein